MSKMRMKICFGVIALLFLTGVFSPVTRAGQDDRRVFCAVYVTGNGCGNCAAVDPRLFTELTRLRSDLVILEYEIYKNRKNNAEVKDSYFKNFLENRRPGIPLLIWGGKKSAVGRIEAIKASEEILEDKGDSLCALSDGSWKPFEEINLAGLPGQVNIWTKNRVLIAGNSPRVTAQVLRQLVKEEDVPKALRGLRYEETPAKAIEISQGTIDFQYAVKIEDWVLQWNGESLPGVRSGQKDVSKIIAGLFVLLVVIGIVLTFFEISLGAKGWKIRFRLGAKLKDSIFVGVSAAGLILFFFFAGKVPGDLIEKIGYWIPLPIFTLCIGLVDGFNPCNMFVLTCLLGLLVSTSSSRKRLYLVGFCFVFVVFLFYFLFMAAWLNVFNYMGFINPLRITLALAALVAGTINCKELLFFKKGISLTIQEKHKGPLYQKMRDLRARVEKGSVFTLIGAAISLAVFSSLIELLCTAGFPIIYTGILTGKGLENTFQYYLYLIFYNVVYVLPLAVIVFVVIHAFKAAHVTQRQVEIMKYIGGIVMILLGLALLVNPMLLGVSIK